MDYTTHTTNVEMHRRVAGHIGNYDTVLEYYKLRRGQMVRTCGQSEEQGFIQDENVICRDFGNV